MKKILLAAFVITAFSVSVFAEDIHPDLVKDDKYKGLLYTYKKPTSKITPPVILKKSTLCTPPKKQVSCHWHHRY